MNTPEPKELSDYQINDPEDTKELAGKLKEDPGLFKKLSYDWQVWFTTHISYIGLQEIIACMEGMEEHADLIDNVDRYGKIELERIKENEEYYEL